MCLPGSRAAPHLTQTGKPWSGVYGCISSEICFDHFGRRAHLVWQTVGDDLALIKNDNPICKIGYHLHVMLDPQHAEFELVLDAQQEPGEALLLLPHQTGRGLVEQ